MKAKKIVDFIHRLEAELEIEKFRVFNFNFWPIIRIAIGYDLDESINREDKSKIQRGVVSKLMAKGQFFNGLLTPSLPSQLKSKQYKRDIVYLTYLEARRTKRGDKKIDAYLNPVYEHLASVSNGVMIDYTLNNRHASGTNLDPVGFNVAVSKAKRKAFLRTFFERPPESLNECLSYINVAIKEVGIDAIIDKKKIIFRINFLYELSRHFERLFRVINPQLVIGSNYYGLEMAACIAAKKMGIKVVDIQHGGQGASHHAYADWPLLNNKNGFEMLPDVFWTWDTISKENIDNWTYSQHSTVCGGNTLLISSLEDSKENDFYWGELKKRTELNKTNILITLQTGVDMVDYFSSLILKCPNNVVWWIRLHPGMMHDLARLESIFSEKCKGQQVELRLASEAPLFIVLNCMQLHITSFSSVIQDANLMGIPSIATNQSAKDLFEHELEIDAFKLCETTKECVEEISKIFTLEKSTSNNCHPLEKHQNQMEDACTFIF